MEKQIYNPKSLASARDSGEFHTIATLPLGKEHLIPNQKDEIQSRSACFGDEKNLLPLPQIKP
jgi:hypothetical protein